jgi:RHS repeat-associated protein
MNLAWPGWQTSAHHKDGNPGEQEYWLGSLVDGMRDASGQIYMRNRYYDPATGQFTQTDPIGLAGGLNAYGFANGDPVSYADPYGLCAQSAGQDTVPEVEVCEAVANIRGNVVGLKHQWFRTDSLEAGLGQAGGGVPGEGEYRLRDNSPFYTQTEITDHSGRGEASGATCRPVSNVNAQCVNGQLQIGESRGRWSPVNHCQTFVRNVLAQCSNIPRTVQRDATYVAPRAPRKP